MGSTKSAPELTPKKFSENYGEFIGAGPRSQIDDDNAPTADEYARLCAREIEAEAKNLELPLPKLRLEPGRALSGPSSGTVGTVGAIKQGDKKNGSTWTFPPIICPGPRCLIGTTTRCLL